MNIGNNVLRNMLGSQKRFKIRSGGKQIKAREQQFKEFLEEWDTEPTRARAWESADEQFGKLSKKEKEELQKKVGPKSNMTF